VALMGNNPPMLTRRCTIVKSNKRLRIRGPSTVARGKP
jgi:hypothetical protein